jgi:hypothetical protein
MMTDDDGIGGGEMDGWMSQLDTHTILYNCKIKKTFVEKNYKTLTVCCTLC